LEVYHDPEIDDTYLALNVRQELYDENIMDMIGTRSGGENKGA